MKARVWGRWRLMVAASVAVLISQGVAAEPRAVLPSGAPLTEDPLLRELVGEALANRPEIARAKAEITAEEQRAPQARVLPDPMLSIGIQNDGFSSIQIGKMETSWVWIVASQTLPWFGKRGLRGEVAGFGRQGAEVDLRRTVLQVAADVQRAYVDLLWVRARMDLLSSLELLWKRADVVTRARYETGEAAQSDAMRTQLEGARLRQQRLTLEADARRRLAVLNRLRGRAAAEPITVVRTLADVSDPVLAGVDEAIAVAVAESPELRRESLSQKLANQRADLARRERWPDVTVSAGVMPRGGFAPMWQAGIAFGVPLWSLQKQALLIAESHARGQAARQAELSTRQLLEQRVRERHEVLGALAEANRLYRTAILPQADALVTSTLVQYQVGRAPFASVLDALSGYLADKNEFLSSVASAQRIGIAEAELSLESPEGGGAGRSPASMERTSETGTESGSSASSAAPGM